MTTDIRQDALETRRKEIAKLMDGRRRAGLPSADPERQCCFKLDCGGSCFREPGHTGDHLCIGDTDGPGSCPA
jgi:hypothetical protein